MHGKVVLVCTDRTRTWRQVTPPLTSAGNRLVHASSTERAASFLASGAVDLALVEWPSGISLDSVMEVGEDVPIVVLVSETGIRALKELICRRGLFHLCAARAEQEASTVRELDPAELVVSCEKILRRDIFGLDKYLAGFGIERPSRIATHADERDAVVAHLVDAVRMLGGGRRIVESVSLVADELFTNAVYNAPRDADGLPRYAHVSRRAKIALEPAEYVQIEFGSDGRTFGLAVSDRFGALRPADLRSAVERCLARPDPIEHKPGGAGIGLFATLCHADHLVFNLDPGVRTEVIALWGLSRKSGGRGAGVASLHVFEQVGSAAGLGAGLTGEAAASETPADLANREMWAALVSHGNARLEAPRVASVGDAYPAAVTPAASEVVRIAELELEPDSDYDRPTPPTMSEILLEVETGPMDDIQLDEPEPETMKELVVEMEPGMMEDLQVEPPLSGTKDVASEVDAGMAPEIEAGGAPEVETEMPVEVEVDEPPAADTVPFPAVGDPPTGRTADAPGPRARAGSADGSADPLAAPPENGAEADLAEVFEMAVAIESGPFDSPTPAWINPLTCLRGVQIFRPGGDGPGFETALAAVRAAPTLADAVEVVLGHLALEWSAAMLLCRVGDTLIPWTAAGDVEGWDEVCEIEVPLTAGWLSARGLTPGVTLAALDDDANARILSDSLTARPAEQGLALSFEVDRTVLVLFACRSPADGSGGDGDDLAPYEELQHELSAFAAHMDRATHLPGAGEQSAGAGG